MKDKELYNKLEQQAKRYQATNDTDVRAKIDMETISILHNMVLEDYIKYIQFYRERRGK